MQDAALFDLCSVTDCCRLVHNKANRLCGRHYTRFWRYGDPEAGGPLRPESRPAKPVQDFPDGTRICNECGQRLPIDDFHKDAGGTLGRRAKCGECHKAEARDWYASNREELAARVVRRRAENPDRHRQWDKERYARNRDKRIALATEHSHKRRIRLQSGEYDKTVTRSALRKQYGDACFYCLRLMDFNRYTHGTKPGDLATIEHVWPISRGGGHTWENVVLACLDCNLRKNARTPEEWAAEEAA